MNNFHVYRWQEGPDEEFLFTFHSSQPYVKGDNLRYGGRVYRILEKAVSISTNPAVNYLFVTQLPDGALPCRFRMG